MTDADRLRHEAYMRRCLALARQAMRTGDTPVGSLIVRGDEILAEGVEAVRAKHDVTAHAEIEALRAAARWIGSRDLSGCTLYTSVAPCIMCAYAIRLARVAVVVSGADTTGDDATLNGLAVLISVDLLRDRPPPLVVRGILSTDCQDVLRERQA